MKKILIPFLLLLTVTLSKAHDLRSEALNLKHWVIRGQTEPVTGSFYLFKDGQVFIESSSGSVVHFPLENLSASDQAYVRQRYARILSLNRSLEQQQAVITQNTLTEKMSNDRMMAAFMFVLALGIFTFVYLDPARRKFLIPAFSLGVILTLSAFTQRIIRSYKTTTSPAFLNSAFAPFKPDVNTRWDSTYFYVESLGIPDHLMMKGITGWQQQVPIPQCYTGSNAWSIPLNPVPADTPVPVNPQHFLRGAIAIAANGIAIFNPYTNTGVDALVDGQLDIFGGHCGRADDYHYHIAPLHLDSKTSDIVPIAFGLDGYAVYGNLEPDGSAMKTLDANHGHKGSNGVYHYHGTTSAPYMIGKMVGKVTEDATLQIIPQASASSIRPAGTPLKGAVITDCRRHSTGNGYTLLYTLSGATDSVVYNWTSKGVYTFKFYTASGTTTSTYNGKAPCTLPSAGIGKITALSGIQVYPNPAQNRILISLSDPWKEEDINEISIYSLNGNLVYSSDHFVAEPDLSALSKGLYLLRIQTGDSEFTKKLILQ